MNPSSKDVPRDHPELGPDPLASDIANLFRSPRLCYRAFEEDDEDFIFRLRSDTRIGRYSSAGWPQPFRRDDAQSYRKHVQGILLGVVIELDPKQPPQRAHDLPSQAAYKGKDRIVSPSPTKTPTAAEAIGTLTLASTFGAHMSQCRTADLAINISAAYQGRGYASEAIRWALDWAFNMAAVHLVRLSCFSYNTKAIRLYDAVGFRRVGVEKEALWLGGRYWDFITYNMLDRDWADIQKGRMEKESI